MADGKSAAERESEQVAARMVDRLRQAAPDYEWDPSQPLFHSSYDNWHTFGVQRPGRPLSTLNTNPNLGGRPSLDKSREESEETIRPSSIEDAPSKPVVARISRHTLRLEREFKLAQKLNAELGSDQQLYIKPIELVKLPPRSPGDVRLVAVIAESPGVNYLIDMVEMGPGFWSTSAHLRRPSQSPDPNERGHLSRRASHAKTPLGSFMTFAVGATRCLENLHQVFDLVHGDLRADAFHFNKETNKVRLINFGSGARSFENGLTSAGWSALSTQLGVEHKLQFVAPEQTGRMPAEPDSRTDIYSLGVLFWIMLADEPAFPGSSPLDIMQNVLTRRLPPIDSKRLDVPPAVSRIITKMTQKSMADRYQSTTGLRQDFLECQRLLELGDTDALNSFKLGTHDISPTFNQPTQLIGRSHHLETIKRVIDQSGSKASARAVVTRKGLTALKSANLHNDMHDNASDSTSSVTKDRDNGAPSTLDAGIHETGKRQHVPSANSLDLAHIDHSAEPRFSGNSRGSNASVDLAPSSFIPASLSSIGIVSSKDSLLRAAQKLRKQGLCDVITICGEAGLGKTSLLQKVQSYARENGYYASARFDTARKTPFESAFRAMSSLFRQIFSESDVSTDLHEQVRALVAPVWESLHAVLELPSWLLSPRLSQNGVSRSAADDTLDAAKGEKLAKPAANWLQSGGGLRDDRFISTFMDLLRLLVMHNFLCLCFDDLQFADEESLDLVSSIVSAGIPIVLILTFRSVQDLPPKIQTLVEHSTRIALTPFTEEQTSEYVTATLHRSEEYLLPLIAVIQQKTGGTPFLVREFLDQCYRQKSIFYSWKQSQWEYNMDDIFNQFSSDTNEDMDTDQYIIRRLLELPTDAKTLLCWASLVGSHFTFALMFQVITCDCSKASPMELLPTRAGDAVAGLQAALASFAIMSTEEEDRFRFSHGRYMAAVKALRAGCHEDEMHYVLSVAMMKHDPWQPGRSTQVLFDQSRHICSAIQVIRNRASDYRPFRELLYTAAQTAQAQGARQIAIYYLKHSLTLLAEDIWNVQDEKANTTYQEVLALMTQTAASYWYIGDFQSASTILEQIFENTTDPADRSAAYVLESRIYAQTGDSHAAFQSLKRALSDLGQECQDRSWKECDEAFHRLAAVLIDRKPDLSPGKLEPNQSLMTVGAVLVELLSAAFWTEPLMFYQLIIQMLDLYLAQGVFPQLALAYVHMASIAIGRFNKVAFGLEMGNVAKDIMSAFPDEAYTNGRCLTLHSLFVGHIETGMVEQIGVLQEGLKATIVAGDKILQTLNLGTTAAYKLWAGCDAVETEAFIMDVNETVPDWPQDVKGGAILTGVLQYVRALQGKTGFREAEHILDDEHHTTAGYHEFVRGKSSNPARPLSIYDCYRLAALYRFGHHAEAYELGRSLDKPVDALLSMKYYYLASFFLALSLAEILRANPDHPEKEQLLKRIQDADARIKSISPDDDESLGSYRQILRAQLAELDRDFDGSIKAYEAAVNHSIVHGLALDEALSNELYAEFLMRRGTSRPARALLDDAIVSYKKMGAHGKVQQMTEKHAFNLHKTGSSLRVEQGTQTTEINTGNSQYKLDRNEDEMASLTSEDRTKAWLNPRFGAKPAAQLAKTDIHSNLQDHAGLSAVGLDMIDLATILESSQLLSSELHVDKLLSKLTHIIVHATGAEVGGVVTEDEEQGWVIGGLHKQEGVWEETEVVVGAPIDSARGSVVQQAALYCLRFRENLFVPNVLEDERFAISRNYRQNYPEGRAIICLPVLHGDNNLLGCIYNEGPARSFTERNTAVLRLLVNQVSISVANAMLFKRLEKASASNAAMVVIQKQALEQARESESKAKKAAKAKDLFLANVSHELRTPLNGVIGMSELLKASKLDNEQEGYAESIRVCADTLLSVINDILDFSKLEAGKMRMFNVQLSLKETISEVVRALSYTKKERGLETVQELELDPAMLVMGDPVRLHQIFYNLVSNSLKFTAKGKVTVGAVVEYEDEKKVQVRCSVSDTGIGISEDHQKKLFLPFSQADGSTARTYGGTGLGLSICKAIVEIMKGRIWLTSEVGKGTTVSFSLPFNKVEKNVAADGNSRNLDPMSIYRVSTDEGKNDNTHDHISLVGIPRNELKVCVAEDNPINQKIATSFVERLGFACEAFADGQQAVDALEAASEAGKPFHLVLMDCQMPVLDGYDATREIRRHKDPRVRNVLVIAMTASAIRGDREKCLEAGMNNYLAKPVRANVLKQMLEGYLSAGDKTVPDLQGVADGIAKKVLDTAESEATAGEARIEAGGKEKRRTAEGEQKELPVREKETQ